MMSRLRRGRSYLLHRRASSSLSLTFVGSEVRDAATTWHLFKLGKRAAARKGKRTAPQLIKNEFYEIERSTGQRKQVRLVGQFMSNDGRYVLLSSSIFRLKARSPKSQAR